MSKKLITIDGPSGVGKGTASRGLADKLGWQWLDSGALYRLVAYASERAGVKPDNIEQLVDLAANLDVVFDADPKLEQPEIILSGVSVGSAIRTESCGKLASIISAHAPVRAALLERQKAFYTDAGLIADGRDMGTVVFPTAPLKIFLTASVEVRAQRRHKQLLQQGENVSIRDLERDIAARDERDMNRSVAPLRPAQDAVLIDTSDKTIESVQALILTEATSRGVI